MKNLALSFVMFAIVFSACAQDTKQTLAFKGYLSFITPNHLGCGNIYRDNGGFRLSDPSFAVSFLRTSGNYQQIELSEASLTTSEQVEVPGKLTQGTIGFRYSYNIHLPEAKNRKLKIFIAPGAHLLANYNTFNPTDPTWFSSRYTSITTELEIAPVITYQLTSHFSIEANIPFTVIGITEEITHHLDPIIFANEWEMQGVPFLGPQYFQGRIGVAFNL